MSDRYEIRFAGSGGQGVILASVIVGEAAALFDEGWDSVQSQSYGPEARGGSCKADVVLSKGEIDYPKAVKPNLQVILTQKACDDYIGHTHVYGTTDLTRKNFNLDKLPTDNDYVLINSESVKAGNLGFYQRQMDLSNGINKIIVNFENQDSKMEFIVYFYDRDVTENMINRTRDVKVTEMVPILK